MHCHVHRVSINFQHSIYLFIDFLPCNMHHRCVEFWKLLNTDDYLYLLSCVNYVVHLVLILFTNITKLSSSVCRFSYFIYYYQSMRPLVSTKVQSMMSMGYFSLNIWKTWEWRLWKSSNAIYGRHSSLNIPPGCNTINHLFMMHFERLLLQVLDNWCVWKGVKGPEDNWVWTLSCLECILVLIGWFSYLFKGPLSLFQFTP